jgi:DNA mismatch repair protein MSH4
LNEIYVLSFETVIKLIDDVRVHIGCLYKVCEGVAMLDMVQSIPVKSRSLPSHTLQTLQILVRYGCPVNVVRPEFNDTLAIRKGRYPMMQGHDFVANDAFASQTCRFQIITGPNMSGKSTYLRQIALFCIMAQIGSL